MNISTSCAILVTFRFWNLRVYAVNNSHFCGDMAKIGISRQISENVWTYLDLLYRLGRCISGDDFPNIRLAVAQGMLQWQPVKYGRCSQTLCGATFTLWSAFDNGLDDRKSAFKRFNGNNQATSCPNLVKLRPVISKGWEWMGEKCMDYEVEVY